MVDRLAPDDAFVHVKGVLDDVDLLFGNLEASYTDDPHPAPSSATPIFPRADNLDVFGRVGFDVLSMANNHIVDAGQAALIDNLERLRAQGVATAGAGADLQSARRPAVIRVGEVTVAFLAYASVFPVGYEARSSSPGLAPLRGYDHWEPLLPGYHAPGTLPRTRWVPDDADFARLAEDLAHARTVADIVVVSVHWGDCLRPHVITEHERRTAHFLADHGADLVVGHHHHTLRGIEWRNGTPIFYGLGHFVFDLSLEVTDEAATMLKTAGEFAIYPREGWPLMPMHPDARLTALAFAEIGAAGVERVGLLPCHIRSDGSVEPVDPESQEGIEVLAHVRDACETQGLRCDVSTVDAPTLGGFRTVWVGPRPKDAVPHAAAASSEAIRTLSTREDTRA